MLFDILINAAIELVVAVLANVINSYIQKWLNENCNGED